MNKMIHSKLIKDGDDFIVSLPKKFVKELNLKANQEVEINIFPKNRLKN